MKSQAFDFDKSTLAESHILEHLKSVCCVSSNNANLVCTDRLCHKYPFICSDQYCQCAKQHKNCLKITFFSIVNKAKTKIIPMNKFSNLIQEKINILIDQLSEIRDKIIQKIQKQFEYHGLTSFEEKIYKQLMSGNITNLTGSTVWQFVQGINNQSIIHNRTKKTYESIQNILQYFNQQKNFSQKQLNQQLQILLENLNLFYTSKVITTNGEVNSIQKYFDDQNIRKAQLVYRASDYNFSISQFWQLCSNINQNLVILKTQSNHKFGAYTPIQWKRNTPWLNIEDPTLSSFLFSLTNNDKFILKKPNDAIIYHDSATYGPDYGLGRDFLICDKADDNQKSQGFINTTYFNQKYQKSNKQSYLKLFGTQDGLFYVKQWQFWKLQFKAKSTPDLLQF